MLIYKLWLNTAVEFVSYCVKSAIAADLKLNLFSGTGWSIWNVLSDWLLLALVVWGGGVSWGSSVGRVELDWGAWSRQPD